METLNSIEFEKVRLSPSIVENFCLDQPQSINLAKVVASEPLLIKGKKFIGFNATSSKFKGTLTFRDCRFDNDVSFKQIKSATSISFINCEFNGNLTLFGSDVEGTISLLGSRINGRLILNGCSSSKLEIQALTVETLIINAQEVPSQISTIWIENTALTTALRIQNITQVEHIKLIDINANTLYLFQIDISEQAQLAIKDSRVNEITLDELKLINTAINFSSTLGENIYLRKCKLDHSELSFEQVILNSMFGVKNCNYINSEIDISTVSCPNFDIEPEFIDFILMQHSANHVHNKQIEKHIKTLILLKNKFAKEHRYDLEDRIFYLLKNVESGFKIKRNQWWKKPFLYITYLLQRWMFGWGVRLRNPIISASVIIAFYALVYYISFDLHETNRHIEYLGEKLIGFNGAGVFSLLAFFGQHADTKIYGNVPVQLILTEFILGVIMITVSVGILIRKLVR